MITHQFKFRINQNVVATDYSEEKQKHTGVVTRRWLAESWDNKLKKTNAPTLVNEYYNILIRRNDGTLQNCEFLDKDLEGI